MADMFIQASLAFTCSNAEMALLEEAFAAADALGCDDEPVPPSPQFLDVFPPEEGAPLAGFFAIFTDPDFPSLGADVEGGNTLEDPGRCNVVIHGMTDFEPHAVPMLIQRCCRETLEQAPIGFEYCWTCSKPRVGEFGGGWCVIHPDNIDSGNTSDALATALRG